MNRSLIWLLLAAVLAAATGASTFNWAWMVPGGELTLDRKALSSSKFCALTFDDGPDAKYTAEIGRILERSGVPGTFFVLGKEVARHPEEITALVAAGHEIASHSWSHPNFTKSSAATIDSQLADTNAELARLSVTPRWFRPPYGAYNRSTVSHAADHGLKTILWSVDPRDWSTPGVEVIVNRVLEGAHPGAVILLHSTNPQTVAALPWIIDGLQDDGYQLVTVSEWARLVSGGEPLAPPRPVPLPQPGAGIPQLRDAPEHTTPPGFTGAAGTLNVISNFSGARELWQVLSHRQAGHELYHFTYTPTQLAPMAEPGIDLPQNLFGGVTQSAAAVPASDSPDSGTIDQPVDQAVLQPLMQFELAELLAGSGDWRFPAEIDSAALTTAPTGPTSPRFYLIKSAGGGWSGSASINGLLLAGRFSGVVVASEFNLTGSVKGLAAPSALYSVGRLDPETVINLSRQDASAILRGCAAGRASYFITVNPDDLTAYRDGGNFASIRFLAEFLLLRSAVAGFVVDPAIAQSWLARTPGDLSIAGFSTGDRHALAVRGNSISSTIVLDPAAGSLYCTRLVDGGTIESVAVSGGRLAVGDGLVILSDFPLAER